jgi:hypothetical protein
MEFIASNNPTLSKLKALASGLVNIAGNLEEPQLTTLWRVELPEISDFKGSIPQVLDVSSLPFPKVVSEPKRMKQRIVPFAIGMEAYGDMTLTVFNNQSNDAIAYGLNWLNLTGDRNGEYKYPKDYCKIINIALQNKYGMDVLTLNYIAWISSMDMTGGLNYESSKAANIKYTLKVIDSEFKINDNIVSKVKSAGTDAINKAKSKIMDLFGKGTSGGGALDKYFSSDYDVVEKTKDKGVFQNQIQLKKK